MYDTRIKKTGYLTLLVVLAIAGFWRVMTFSFWIDDWPLLWGSLYHISSTFRFYDHPGTPLVFLILSHISGLHYPLWAVYGISIKVISAYLAGLFLYKFTNAKLAGFLAGVLFVVSYAGYEVIDTPSSSVAGLVAIAMLISLVYFIKTIRGDKRCIWFFIFFLIISIILDPGRGVTLLFILPFLLVLLPQTKEKIIMKKFLLKLFIGMAVMGIPLFLFGLSILNMTRS